MSEKLSTWRALFYYIQGGESMITEIKGGWENDSRGGGIK